MPAFEVFAYDLERLITLLADGAYPKSVEEIRKKRQILYFKDYLAAIGAKTLIVEHGYIDRDFLEDYAAYYVRCFRDYNKACMRIHFFRDTFATEAVSACFAGDERQLSADSLSKAYLGFMVVKPLPHTVIGRTCLVTYSDKPTRWFPAAREFEAHLFGIRLGIVHTLPFQEQDSVVAACATSALWTLFQATARQFQHQVLSPIEITRAATHLLPTETRVIPNNGLSTHMMAHAIKSVNLEPFLIQVSEAYLLQAAIYSYVHARIPLILGIALADTSENGKHHIIGKHAIAVSGYNLGGKPTPITRSGLLLRASRIDKIYVHDDQIGPFARMELDGGTIEFRDNRNEVRKVETLSTSWPSSRERGQVRAVPDILLVPLYHKVRISWEWVLKRVTEINAFLTELTSAEHTLKLNVLEWDVYLTTVNEVRTELRKAESLDASRRFASVTRPMPRFIWRATALRDEKHVLDILFDATDVDTGDALAQALFYDDFAREFVKGLAAAGDVEKLPFAKGVRRFVSWVAENS